MKPLTIPFILVFLAIAFTSFALAEYIPGTGCTAYPDKLVCLEPSQINTTAYIKDVSCYTIDMYGSGAWTILPCIANATIENTNVEVCYKMLPYENGQPNISGYESRYNCHEESWAGPVQLQIPKGIIPWDCNEVQVDNYTKECKINIGSWYSIQGIGNDDNGTKVIQVISLREKVNYWPYVIGGIVLIVIIAYIARKIAKRKSSNQ